MVSELLKKRSVELLISGFIQHSEDLNALKDVYGEKVNEIIAKSRAEKTKAKWANIASKIGRNDFEGLKMTLWDTALSYGFEFTTKETEEGTQFCVTKCPIADVAKATGAVEWGLLCHCNDDYHLVEGFNPEMGFRRTKTLMEGDDCCDHFYFMKKKEK